MLETVLAAIDSEIHRLTQARSLLSGTHPSIAQLRVVSGSKASPVKRGRGRPPMSAEARAKIAQAQKSRWAKAKKAA